MGVTEWGPDAGLVRRARAGDGEAFGALVDRYMRAAYAVALSVTGSHEDAEDASQEAFMVALERLEDCRRPERFAGWLMTIVRNRSRNLVRREVLRGTDPMPPRHRGRIGPPNGWSSESGSGERFESSPKSRGRSCCCTTGKAGSTERSPHDWACRPAPCART